MNTSNLLTNAAATRLTAGSTLCKTLLTLSLGLLVLSPAVAQDARHPQEQSIPAATQIDQQSLQLPPAVIPPLKRVLIPRSGKKQAPPRTFTLPDGAKARVSDLRRRFAAEEAQLNQYGFSLFDPNQPTLDLEPDIDYSKLERQRQELTQHENTRDESPKGGNGRAQIESGGVGSYYWPWNWSQGDQNYFQVSLSAYLNVFSIAGYSANPYLSASAEGIAAGAVLGNKFTIADAYASARATNGETSGSFSFQVLGNYIVNWNGTQTWAWNWWAQQEVAESYQVWIGPIPVTGRMGVRGSVGCACILGLNGDAIAATATPNADLAGFAEVGIGIGFNGFGVGVGVGGQLTFLQCGFPVRAETWVQWSNGQPQLVIYASSSLQIDTLSGYFYIWAELLGWRGQWTLWNWNGVNFDTTLDDYYWVIDL